MLDPLGRGGMGSVWLAEDEMLGRRVALKFLAGHLLDSPEARARFLREARAASHLDHPGIATIYDVGESGGQPYIAQRFIPGITLRAQSQAGPADAARVREVGGQLAAALAHAHDRGVLHRDVSPANVLCGDDGGVVLVDFGLARAMADARVTDGGAAMGTLPYVAPEILSGHDADPRSDLYSLAVVLFELLAGRLPFDDPTPAAYLHAVTHAAPRDLGTLRPDVPADLTVAIMRALEREPNARYQHAAHFGRALRGAADPPTTRLLPRTTPPAATRRKRRSDPDPAAHEHFVEALAYLRRPDQEAALDRALAILKGLVASEGGAATLHAAMARAHLYRFYLTQEPDSEARAAAELARARARDPRAPEVLLAEGELLRMNGRLTEAKRVYHQAVELRRDLPEAWLGLSWANEGLGDPALAENDARQAIALAPDDWRGYSRLAAVLYNQGRYARAVEPWRRAVELTPDNALAWSSLGSALFRLDRLEEALESYQRSLQIRPTARAHVNAGTALFYLGRREEALTNFETATRLSPADARMWGNLGMAARLTPGSEAKAATALANAIERMEDTLRRDPSSAQNWGWLATWLAAVGRVPEAEAAIARALQATPGDVECMVMAGGVADLCMEDDRAIEWYERAVRLGYGISRLERDPSLERLRQRPDWARVVGAAEAAREAHAGRQESIGGAG